MIGEESCVVAVASIVVVDEGWAALDRVGAVAVVAVADEEVDAAAWVVSFAVIVVLVGSDECVDVDRVDEGYLLSEGEESENWHWHEAAAVVVAVVLVVASVRVMLCTVVAFEEIVHMVLVVLESAFEPDTAVWAVDVVVVVA